MKSTFSKVIDTLIEVIITGAILLVIFLAFTSCSSDSESPNSGSVTVETYNYTQYNYVAGAGKQYTISATVVNSTQQSKTGAVIFDFTEDGNRNNDLSLPYTIAAGQTQTFTTSSPVFISTGATLKSVYIQ